MSTQQPNGYLNAKDSPKREKVRIIPSSRPTYSRVSQGYVPRPLQELTDEQAEYKRQEFITKAEESYIRLKALVGEETARRLTKRVWDNQKYDLTSRKGS